MMTTEPRYILEDERFIPTGFALDRLGLHLYPATWIGCHVGRDRPDDPRPVLKRNKDLQTIIDDAKDTLAILSKRISRATDPETTKTLEALRDKTLQERSDAYRELDSKSAINEESVEDYKYFSKIDHAQEILENAMRGDGLNIFTGDHLGRSLGSIENRRGVHIRIRDSYLIEARFPGKRRRGIMMLDREQFMAWLSKIEPVEAAPGQPLTPAQAFRIEVREVARIGQKPKNVGQYRNDARRRIPGLTKSVAQRVWEEEVPEDWRRPGRRAAPKK
ncbi:hypothetical protein [Minwuia sp. IMCC3009]|uniref:hypothetical protein n=1 Tax=Minwuia sp. IMCC3009 TaxID=3040674 RepID=UPI002479EF7E|nr:hypothetical protein [Minwuia sp. IMCC3009]